MTHEDIPAFPPRGSHAEVEDGLLLRPKFGPDGLIPCIACDAHTNEVVMFAFMNEQALRHTLATGRATYWSRSRNKLWVKGEESGNVQLVREVRVDCDQDVVLIRVEVVGGASCHTGYRSCFYRRVADAKGHRLEFAEAAKVFDPKAVYGR